MTQYHLCCCDLQVKTITALSLAALAEAASPYGIESFDDVLEPLWRGIRSLRGKVLAAFLKCIGFIIPLMDTEHAFYYTREVMVVLKREFQTPDEEMKKIVLKVRAGCLTAACRRVLQAAWLLLHHKLHGKNSCANQRIVSGIGWRCDHVFGCTDVPYVRGSACVEGSM